jgi:hypothetical protein
MNMEKMREQNSTSIIHRKRQKYVLNRQVNYSIAVYREKRLRERIAGSVFTCVSCQRVVRF